ncbi:hypothetical protein KUCAC02_028977, partial [Chaenocephalus aceratus]
VCIQVFPAVVAKDVFLRILKNTKDKPVVSKLELKDLKSGSRKAVRGYIKIVVEYVKRTDSVYWTPKVTFGVKDIRHSKAQLAMTLSTCNFSLPAVARPHGAASMRDALPASIRQTERLRMQSRRSLVLAPGGLPSQLVVYVPAGDQPPSSNINSGKRDTTTMYPFIRLQQDLSGSLVTRNKPQILAVCWQCALPCADGISVLVPASG